MASPGSLIPLAPPQSLVTLSTPRTCKPFAVLCFSTPMTSAGASLPPAPPQSSGTPGFTSDARHRGSAQASCASGVTWLHRLSVFTLGSPEIGSVSIGRPTDVVGHTSTLAPPSINTAMGCLHSALGLQHLATPPVIVPWMLPPSVLPWSLCLSAFLYLPALCLLLSSPSPTPQPPPKPPPYLPLLFFVTARGRAF
ncbi:hypothetical protein M9458_016643 [Cirrhinus mrigala]|uniref:Uncharacterized protein n=1 Tax=Cirrhinus mrigala TaxID=683832 RepID=A0ABD0QTK0_CIRMR